MFASFRRHQKWIWIVAMIVVIPSFVIFFTNTQYLSKDGASGPVPDTMVNGKPVSRSEMVGMSHEAVILYRLNAGQWPPSSAPDLKNFALNRLAQVRKAQDAGVVVPDDVVVQGIKRLFRDQNGGYNPEAYKRFVTEDMGRSGNQLTEDDLFQFVKHDLEIEQLRSVYGLSGRLVTSRGLEPLFRHSREQAGVDLVMLQASNFVSKVVVNTNDLSQFYSNRQANYFIPPRVSLAYVEYRATNYLALADKALAKDPQLDAKIEQYYQQRLKEDGTNAFVGDDKKPLSPEAAHQKIKDEQRQRLSLAEARKDAVKFASQVIEKDPHTLANFQSVADVMKLPIKATEPFDDENGPSFLKPAHAFTDVAFRLTPEEAVSVSPIVGEDAVYVVALKQQIPRKELSLEAVHDKVVVDYKEFQSQVLMRTAGNTLQTNLNKAITAGKSFKDACAELKVTTTSMPPFSRTDRSIEGHEDLPGFARISNDAFKLKPGKIGQFVSMGETGFIVHVRERLPVSEDVVKAELPKFLDQQRDRNTSLAFSDWLMKHVQIAAPQEKESQP